MILSSLSFMDCSTDNCEIFYVTLQNMHQARDDENKNNNNNNNSDNVNVDLIAEECNAKMSTYTRNMTQQHHQHLKQLM